MMFSYRDLFSQACKQGLPPHEVQLLLEHLTALSRTALLLRMDDPAPDLLVQQLNEMVQQRLTGYPLQYLLGVQADVLTWQPQQLFDLITSNPPYISDQEMLELQPEVRWEPEMALRAQENGLYFYRVLSKRCQSYLRTGGWLLFEIGYTQGQAVSDLLLAEGYTDIRLIPDYNGNDRVVAARWQPAER